MPDFIFCPFSQKSPGVFLSDVEMNVEKEIPPGFLYDV